MFNFISQLRVQSENDLRTYNGTTYYEMNLPFTQRIHILDHPQLDGVFEINLTESELHSNETFCKSISHFISCK